MKTMPILLIKLSCNPKSAVQTPRPKPRYPCTGSLTFYLAITSTYPLPFLPFLTVPPFRGCGAPIKSSILLALLIPVAGLDGGAEGGAEGSPELRDNPLFEGGDKRAGG